MIYTVDYVAKLGDVDIFARSSEMTGQIDYVTATIRVYDGGRHESVIRQTLWHEIVHAICFGLHISTDKGELGNNEKVVDMLATGINLVIQDNPGLRS